MTPKYVHYYVLDDDGHPRAVDDVLVWARWFETADRTVAVDQVSETVRVSTVFLALDHNYGGEGAPVLWETMIFGGPHDGAMWRYASRASALAGHAEALALAAHPEGSTHGTWNPLNS